MVESRRVPEHHVAGRGRGRGQPQPGHWRSLAPRALPASGPSDGGPEDTPPPGRWCVRRPTAARPVPPSGSPRLVASASAVDDAHDARREVVRGVGPSTGAEPCDKAAVMAQA